MIGSIGEIEVGTVIDGDYEIVELIGQGGMSTVWAARRPRLANKKFAIKFLSGSGISQREADVLSQLDHPNIVHIWDYNSLADGTPYLVLERLQGETLEQRLERGRLSWQEAVEIATQIGSALTAAHQRGVFHRDLKPSNVMLSPTTPPSTARHHVTLLDFGIAAVPSEETLETTWGMLGTPRYMAPESIHGDAEVDGAKADVFSLGAVVYEMIAGVPAFGGRTAQEVAMRVLHRPIDPLRTLAPSVPSSIAQAVEQALEKDPERRFATVTSFTSKLIAADFDAARHSPERVRQGLVIRRRTALMSLVLGGAVVVAIASMAPLTLELIRGQNRLTLPAPIENAVAVLEFENQRPTDAESDWYRRALQAAFNTEFSKVPKLIIVAPEEIRRTADEHQIDSLSAARFLGAQRLVTGSFAVLGEAMRIDARIIERRGRMELAAEVEGAEREFFRLQRQLTQSVLDRFNVARAKVSDDVVARPNTASLDKYRMLLEAEGVTTSNAADNPAAPSPPSSRDGASWRAPVIRSLVLLRPRMAHAESLDPGGLEAVERTLEAYRQAHENADVQGLAAIYTSLSDSQRRAVAMYADNVDDLRVDLEDIRIEPRGTDISVSYTRRDHFVDRETREPLVLEVRLTKLLVLDEGRWKFAAEK